MTRSSHYFYEPAQGHGLPHDPLNAIIGPRPIGWIASVNAKGQRNLAPYSFFNCFNYHPPIIGFSSAGWKDSVANIHATGEFVWNLVMRPLAATMNETSASLPAGEDEFAVAGLTPVQGECRFRRIRSAVPATSDQLFRYFPITHSSDIRSRVRSSSDSGLVIFPVLATPCSLRSDSPLSSSL
ncbi:flavin reductase family protein [Candidatus Sodalis pierantonius]|uniref:flavin reductase family protein n=1 Tax=Candidatus Sodalis pierantonii TaxID=1486991 RepID=UPI00046D91A1|nr:flavin reductase family protein [Candidatus Sodalis pierantonius]